MKRDHEAGFTLIETLVALAVLAISSVALLGAVEAHIARIGALEYRMAALVAAQNYLAEVGLGVPPEAEVALLGIGFAVTGEWVATGEPELRRLNIAVADRADGKVYARLTGFVASAGFAADLQVAP